MNTLIINYSSMKLGGIETNIFMLVKALINAKTRIIWLCSKNLVVADCFKEIMLGDSVERVFCNTHYFTWFKHDQIHFSPNENVIILSFSPIDMARSLEIKENNFSINVKCYYVMPHFTTNFLFLERNFPPLIRVLIKQKLKKIFINWDLNSAFYFFSLRHLQEIEKVYGLSINYHEDKQWKTYSKKRDFPISLVAEKSLTRKDVFNIITVGRFEFPHKGYIIGLVNEFATLKESYPQLKLFIIGYGNGEKLLKNIVSNFSIVVKSDIFFLGQVSPSELSGFFDRSHVNISVAGAVVDGAKNGLVSLPARHYSTNCEVYGYLPNSRNMTTDSTPGRPVGEYIKELIHMSEEEYIKKCKESYDTFPEKDNAIDWFLPINQEGLLGYSSFFKFVNIFYVLHHYLIIYPHNLFIRVVKQLAYKNKK